MRRPSTWPKYLHGFASRTATPSWSCAVILASLPQLSPMPCACELTFESSVSTWVGCIPSPFFLPFFVSSQTPFIFFLFKHVFLSLKIGMLDASGGITGPVIRVVCWWMGLKPLIAIGRTSTSFLEVESPDPWGCPERIPLLLFWNIPKRTRRRWIWSIYITPRTFHIKFWCILQRRHSLASPLDPQTLRRQLTEYFPNSSFLLL